MKRERLWWVSFDSWMSAFATVVLSGLGCLFAWQPGGTLANDAAVAVLLFAVLAGAWTCISLMVDWQFSERRRGRR